MCTIVFSHQTAWDSHELLWKHVEVVRFHQIKHDPNTNAACAICVKLKRIAQSITLLVARHTRVGWNCGSWCGENGGLSDLPLNQMSHFDWTVLFVHSLSDRALTKNKQLCRGGHWTAVMAEVELDCYRILHYFALFSVCISCAVWPDYRKYLSTETLQ